VRKEALEWDARVRTGINRGVCFGGSIKWTHYNEDSIASVGGGGVFTVNRLRHQIDLGHVPKGFRELIKRLPRFTETKTTLSWNP
jgi:hypothetical protein